MKKISHLVIYVIVLLLCGCAGNGGSELSYVREGIDLGYIKRIAVLPFENNTREEFAAQRIRDITATQVLSMGLFDVADKGAVDTSLREMGINRDTPLDVPLVKRLGQRLGVQGIIIGTVNSLGENRQDSFTFSEVSLTLQLLECESAQTVWRSSDSHNGYSITDRLFGLAPMDTFQVTVELLHRMLNTIPR